MTVADEVALLGFIAVCVAAALGGAIWRPGSWYARLAKPSWTPPNWLFGPAWAVLFAMIATSGWLAWREIGLSGAPVAFAVYALQLVLNFFWSGIFFGRRRMGLAALELSALWAAILANVLLFAEIDAVAALLLVPYLLWVSFAFALNVAIWRLNPTVDGERLQPS